MLGVLPVVAADAEGDEVAGVVVVEVAVAGLTVLSVGCMPWADRGAEARVVRRMLFFVAAMGTALALAGCAGQDSVILTEGPGNGGGFRDIQIYAVSGPTGESAGGSVVLESLVDGPRGPVWVRFGGPVTCLAVDGNDAVLKFDANQGLASVIVGVHDGDPDTLPPALRTTLATRRTVRTSP